MSDVLAYAREQDPRFKDVPDGELTLYLGESAPDLLKDPRFAADFAMRKEQEAAAKAAAAAEGVGGTLKEFAGDLLDGQSWKRVFTESTAPDWWRALKEGGTQAINSATAPAQAAANVGGKVLNKTGALLGEDARKVAGLAGLDPAGPVAQGIEEAGKTIPVVAGAMALQAAGVPAAAAFALPPAASAFEASGGDLGATAKAAATGVLIPPAVAAGREAASVILRKAIGLGLVNAGATTGQKIVEALGGQTAVQALLEGLNLTDYALMDPDKRVETIQKNAVANIAFLAMDVPGIRDGNPSLTQVRFRNELIGHLSKLVNDPEVIASLAKTADAAEAESRRTDAPKAEREPKPVADPEIEYSPMDYSGGDPEARGREAEDATIPPMERAGSDWERAGLSSEGIPLGPERTQFLVDREAAAGRVVDGLQPGDIVVGRDGIRRRVAGVDPGLVRFEGIDDPVDKATLAAEFQPDLEGRRSEIISATATAGGPRKTAAELRQWRAATPDGGSEVGGEYRVVDADSLVSSFDPEFDQTLQPRDRSRTASKEQIVSIASNLDPARLADSPTTDGGAPIVDDSGQVLSGNGRISALRMLYGSDQFGTVGPAENRAQVYRDWLRKNADRFGISPTAIAAMSKPVLVRVVHDYGGVTKAEFARRSNQSTILGTGASEAAAADGRMLIENPELLALFRPSETGDVTAASNRPFLAAFIKGTGASAELLTADGYDAAAVTRRVNNAILAAILGPERRALLAKLIEGADDLGIKNVVRGVTAATPALMRLRGTRYDLSGVVGQALTDLVSWKGSGDKLLDYLRQSALFANPDRTAATDELMEFFANAGSMKEVEELLARLVERARIANDDTQSGGLFGAEPPPTMETLVKQANVNAPKSKDKPGAKSEASGTDAQPDLVGSTEPPKPEPEPAKAEPAGTEAKSQTPEQGDREIKAFGVYRGTGSELDRPMVILDVNGSPMAFYRSSKGTSGKIPGEWYPFFGVRKDGWIVKGSIEDMEGYYGSPDIKKAVDFLNRRFGGKDAAQVEADLRATHGEPLGIRQISERAYGRQTVDVNSAYELALHITETVKRAGGDLAGRTLVSAPLGGGPNNKLEIRVHQRGDGRWAHSIDLLMPHSGYGSSRDGNFPSARLAAEDAIAQAGRQLDAAIRAADPANAKAIEKAKVALRGAAAELRSLPVDLRSEADPVIVAVERARRAAEAEKSSTRSRMAADQRFRFLDAYALRPFRGTIDDFLAKYPPIERDTAERLKREFTPDQLDTLRVMFVSASQLAMYSPDGSFPAEFSNRMMSGLGAVGEALGGMDRPDPKPKAKGKKPNGGDTVAEDSPEYQFAKKQGIPDEKQQEVADQIAREEAEQQELFGSTYPTPDSPTPSRKVRRPVVEAATPVDPLLNSEERAATLTREGKGGLLRALSEYPIVSAIRDIISGRAQKLDIVGARIRGPADFAALLAPLRSPHFESLKVAVLDARGRVAAADVVAIGTLDSTLTHFTQIVEVVRKARTRAPDAKRVYIAHNHPSGNPTPSESDIRVTRTIAQQLERVGVELVDHVVTNGHEFHSINRQATMSYDAKRPDWEAIPREKLPTLDTPDRVQEFAKLARQGDPDAYHILYSTTRMTLNAVERISGLNRSPEAVIQAVMEGTAREGAYAVFLDFGNLDHTKIDPLLRQLRAATKNIVRVLDVSNHAIKSYREMGWIPDDTFNETPLDRGQSVREDAPALGGSEGDKGPPPKQPENPEPADDPQFTAFPMAFPEAVQFARSLAGGASPRLKEKVAGIKGALGAFIYGGAGRPRIELARRSFDLPAHVAARLRDEARAYGRAMGRTPREQAQFERQRYDELRREEFQKEPTLALQTLWHEIGHWVDYLPDELIRGRGNLLGHVAALKKHLASTLPELPGLPNRPITPREKEVLMTQAKEQLRKEMDSLGETVRIIVTEEPIFRDLVVTPDLVKAMFGIEAREKFPELYRWFAELDADTKKEIVKAAMKGAVDPRFAAAAGTGKEQIGTKRTEREERTKGRWPTEAEIAERFQKLFMEEMKRRRLVSLEMIRAELDPLIAWWNNAETIPAYFKTPEEMYAEAFSIFVNNPAAMAARAPTYYRLLHNYMNARPQVAVIYRTFQNLISSGQIMQHRVNLLRSSWRQDDAESMDRARSRERTRWRDVLDNVLFKFDDRLGPIYQIARAAGAAGGRLRQAAGNFRYRAAEHERFLGRVNREVVRPLFEAGIDRIELSEFMFHNHVIDSRYARDPQTGLERPIGNSQGWNPHDSRIRLQEMRRQLGEEQWRRLNEAHSRFRMIYEDQVVDLLRRSGLTTPELQKAIDDRIFYATFQRQRGPVPQSEIQQLIDESFGNGVGARIFPQLGNLGDIKDPFTATVLKSMALTSSAYRNIAKRVTAQTMLAISGDRIQPAPLYYTGRRTQPVIKTKGPAKTLVYMENGRVRAYDVPAAVVDAIDSSGAIDNVVALASMRALGGLKAFFTQLRPGFWPVAAVRDFVGWNMQLPGATPIDYLREFIPAFYRSARTLTGNRSDPIVNRALRRKMLTSRRDTSGHLSTVGNEFDLELAAYGMDPVAWGQAATVGNFLSRAWQVYRELGQIPERAHKIAGMTYLDRRFPTMPEYEKQELVRERAGSPDFLRKGAAAPFLDWFVMFYNPWKEGIRSVAKAARDNPVEFAVKTAIGTLVPTMLQSAAVNGWMGEDKRDQYGAIPDYDLTNYLCVPLGWVDEERNKLAYLRLPLWEPARLMHGVMFQAATRRGEGIVSFGAGQVPGMNPALAALWMWGSYELFNQNPYDSFRGRLLMDPDTFAAGGAPAHEALMKETWNKLGMGIAYHFQNQPPSDPAPGSLEKFLRAPGVSDTVGRWIKVSNRGTFDQDRAAAKPVAQREARIRLAVRAAVQKELAGQGERWTPEETAAVETPEGAKFFRQTLKELSKQRADFDRARAAKGGTKAQKRAILER